ncbi:MAG: hypothetical protein KY458_02080 [Actinobacteria bacterium]|nr:hypothetical protein [Actinomycetota bacterium]
MEESNPAKRLAWLLAQLRERRSISTENALEVTLGIDEQDDSALAMHLAAIVRLPGEIERDLGRLPFPTDNFVVNLQPLYGHVRTLFQLGQSIDQFNGALGEGVRVNLDNCADLLASLGPERVPTREQLDEWRDEITDLADEVRTADDISDELREFLLGHLEEMLIAITMTRVSGSGPLRDAYYRLRGHAVVAPAHVAEEAKKSSACTRFWDVVGRIADVIQIGTALALPFAAPVELPPAPAPPPIVMEAPKEPPLVDSPIEVPPAPAAEEAPPG